MGEAEVMGLPCTRAAPDSELLTGKAQCFPAQNNLTESQVAFHIFLIRVHKSETSLQWVSQVVFVMLSCLCECTVF